MSFTTDETLFLINPNSGKGNYKKIIASLKKTDSNVNYQICKSKEDLPCFFSSIDKKYKVLVICGGDGTVNSILPYTKNTKLIFAVLPNGSGNGFAREMGYVKNVITMLAMINKGAVRKIDVVKINNSLFCNIAGIGFDSYIAQQFDTNGKRGLTTYVLESLKAFFKYTSLQLTIDADNLRFEGRFFMLTIANTRQFGNNAIIAPAALPDDGLLDLVMIKDFPRLLTPLVVFQILKRKNKDSKYIQYIKAKNVLIKTDYTCYHVDGEPVKTNKNKLEAKVVNSMAIINSN